MGLLFFFKSWEFVCLHRSLSTLSQSQVQESVSDFNPESESESHKNEDSASLGVSPLNGVTRAIAPPPF